MTARTEWKLMCVGLMIGFAATAQAQYPAFITGFEPGPEGLVDPGGEGEYEVIWQEPYYSGATQGILCELGAGGTCVDSALDAFGLPWDNSQVVSWAQYTDAHSYEIYFVWEDPLNTNGLGGVRATTEITENFARPSVHLDGKIRFKMAVTAFEYNEVANELGPQTTGSILMCLALTETGNHASQGQTDPGSGDLEFVYLPGSEVVPVANSNGMISWPPGGMRFDATPGWPPIAPGQWHDIEFDLENLGAIRGYVNDGDGIDTAGDGVLDATSNGDGVNRGNLESILFTNDSTDPNGQVFFIYIDDVEFEAPVPDPTPRPDIQGPVYDTNTDVLVDCCSDCDTATLMIDGNTNGAHRDVDCLGTPKVATFGVTGMLTIGDVLTATQKRYAVKSPPSLPVVVYAEGTALADDFDGYASQEDLETVWSQVNVDGDQIDPPVGDRKLRLGSGSASSCENMVLSDFTAGQEGARLAYSIGTVDGSDTIPLVVTYRFRHDSNNPNARTRFELAPDLPKTFGAVGFAFSNGVLGLHQEQYTSMTNSPSPVLEGYTSDYFGYDYALTGVNREAGEWHKMQIEVLTDVVNFYIDDQLANPVGTNGLPLIGTNGLPVYPDGVTRVNNNPFKYVIIGTGYKTSYPAMRYDDIAVTLGKRAWEVGVTPFGDPHPVESPDVLAPVYPGDDEVTVVNINSNATRIDVYLNGGGPPIANSNGPFLDNVATVTVPALSDGDVINATQTDIVVTPIESCYSASVVVAVPSVTVEPQLVPAQTTVEVSDLDEGLADKVTVYRDLGGGAKDFLGEVLTPATEPVLVSVPPLTNGDTIVATQTIGGAESPDSAGVVVGVPAPLLLSNLAVGDTLVTVEDIHLLTDTVTVYVNDVEVGSTNGLSPTTDVSVDPALADGNEVHATQTIGGTESPASNSVLVSAGLCDVIYFPDLSDPAGWTINASTNGPPTDHVVTFGYNYGLMGIPPAPGSADTSGLKIEANVAAGFVGGVTMSQLGETFSGNYVFGFDFWHNYNGPAPAGGTGSTEMTGGGVGYDGVTVNTAMHGGYPLVSGGTSLFANGDCLSSRVWRMYKDSDWPASSGEQSVASGQYAVTTNAHTSPEFATIAPAVDIAQFNQGGNQTGTTQVGGPAFAWHHVTITVDQTAGTARIVIDGLHLGTLDANIGNPTTLAGPVQLSHYDPYSSLSGEYGFAVFDNVYVAELQVQGSTLGDWDDDGDIDRDDYVRFEDCLAGPGVAPVPMTGAGCRNFCLDTFDFDGDGDLDLFDFAEFTTVYTGP